jgi:hypothetical protein
MFKEQEQPTAPYAHPGFAAWMGSVFYSATRGCAHSASLDAGELAVLGQLGLVPGASVARARHIASTCCGLEVRAEAERRRQRGALRRKDSVGVNEGVCRERSD